MFVLFCFQVFDQSALSNEAKEEMYKLYPNARRAHLKTGGNFPYLCRSAEVNLYIQVSDFYRLQNKGASICGFPSSFYCTGLFGSVDTSATVPWDEIRRHQSCYG